MNINATLHIFLLQDLSQWILPFLNLLSCQVRYKTDCEELYGRVLDNQNVVSSTRATCRKQTEEIWKRMYPDEPYELNMSTHFPEHVENFQNTSKSTEYDLISAVKRQSPFFYQEIKKLIQVGGCSSFKIYIQIDYY